VSLPGDAALVTTAARRLLERHTDRLPDLSGIIVLVPNHRAGEDFARALAQAAGRAALVPPDILPLTSWAARLACGRADSAALRLARLAAVLRGQAWLGSVDRWALAQELLQLVDALAAERASGAARVPLRAGVPAGLEREIALVETVWQMQQDGNDPQSRYLRALDALADAHAAAPRPLFGYDLGPLNGAERRLLERCAQHAALEIVTLDSGKPRVRALAAAWFADSPPLAERAAALAAALPDSPLANLRLAPAAHLEAEARCVVAWVVEQLTASRNRIALVALDRETARRVRALLERLDVLVADETGWTLSTTAAAAVVDRWLECVARDCPHRELLDLLKSPFALGDPALRLDAVHAFELALRRRGLAQGTAAMLRLACDTLGETPEWLARLSAAIRDFPRARAPLAVWLARLLASLDTLDARAPLARDAAGRALLDALETLARDLAADATPYSLAEWRHWLDRTLEAENFRDTSITSPVVLTALPHTRGRRFDAVAIIGADARHLPPRPAPGLFAEATRVALGLPAARDAATGAAADLLALVAPVPALFSWQAWRGDEPNPASPLILRLDALHRAAWGRGLDTQAESEPPTHAGPAIAPAPRPAPVVDAQALPHRYAAASYQTLLDCPYRFFVERVLRVRALDDADDPLDKSDYGQVLHRILKRFHDGDPPCEREAARTQLAELTHAEFADLPAFTAAAWASRWEPVLPAYVDAWLAWHAEGWRYVSGETEFSQTHDVPGLGTVDLFGILDRVDSRVDPDGFVARAVFDYKTGSVTALRKKAQAPDEAVQLPFYAWLADAAAAFLPLSETPVERLDLPEETDVGSIAERLPVLLEAVAAGAPLPAQGVEADCQWCEARGVCRKGMWTQPG